MGIVFRIFCISLIGLGSITRIAEGAIPSSAGYGGGSKEKSNESLHTTIITLNQILIKEPDNPKVLMKLGDIYRELHAYNEAVNFYNKVLKLDPKNILTHLCLGDIYLKQQKYELAEIEFKTASALDPDDLHIIEGLMMFSFAMDKLDEVLDYGERVLKKEPNDVGTLNVMGFIYIERRQIEKATSTFKHILSLENSPTAHQNLSVAYMLNESYDLAERELKKVIELRPDDYRSFKNIGIFYLKQGEASKALFYLNEALILNPRDAELYLCLADRYEESGDMKKAIDYYRMSISLNPTDTFVLMKLARLYYKMGKIAESLNLCRGILEIEPQNKEANLLIISIKNKEEIFNIGKDSGEVGQKAKTISIGF